MTEVSAFDLLHRGVQKAIRDKGWERLNAIQVESIQAIYGSSDHLLISAQTAGGKTEAAFLPVLSRIAENTRSSIQALYVGPLRALINDQFQRLELLCESLAIPVHRWHGEVSGSEKHSVIQAPGGVLLITPESLEAIFLRKGRHVPRLFAELEYVVVDELHSFLDGVRGIHLQSLLSRVRTHARCQPRMLGLSATLGNYEGAARFLDIDAPSKVRLIENPKSTRDVKLGLKAFISPRPQHEEGEALFAISPEQARDLLEMLAKEHLSTGAPLQALNTDIKIPSIAPDEDDCQQIAKDIARNFRSSTNLVFGNSKQTIEILADRLHEIAGAEGWPQDPFVVHHASLSREIRDEAERRLKSGLPTTALCSSTMEMGIDISGIRAVGQIQSPWSVASLLQRLGRSGRREGEAAILRLYTRDHTIHPKSTLTDLLFPDLIQAIAMIQLMISKWIEVPEADALNLSTLVHQILSHLMQTGGLSSQELFDALVKKGPFRTITPEMFQEVLRSLMDKDLIESTPENLLIVGLDGEKVTASRDFYAAFLGKQEVRVIFGQEEIGTLPATRVPPLGENLLLGGRRWAVMDINAQENTVSVMPAQNLKPPFFDTSGKGLHPKIAEQMKAVLLQDDLPPYIDPAALLLLSAARRVARLSGAVSQNGIVTQGEATRLYPWHGSKVLVTLIAFARLDKIPVDSDSFSITYRNCSSARLIEHLKGIVSSSIDPKTLAAQIPIKCSEKFDDYLSEQLLDTTNGQRLLDVETTKILAQKIT